MEISISVALSILYPNIIIMIACRCFSVYSGSKKYVFYIIVQFVHVHYSAGMRGLSNCNDVLARRRRTCKHKSQVTMMIYFGTTILMMFQLGEADSQTHML